MHEESVPASLSIVDSALILAMFSAACYIMGQASQIGTARRVGLPYAMMPPVGPEEHILVGGTYLVLIAAVGLLLYFTAVLLIARVRFVQKLAVPILQGVRLRVTQHPRVYFLLACLVGATATYTLPLSLPLMPRSEDGPSVFGAGRVASDVVALGLMSPDDHVRERRLRYLWQGHGVIVLQDKKSREVLVLKEQEVWLMIVAAPGLNYGAPVQLTAGSRHTSASPAVMLPRSECDPLQPIAVAGPAPISIAPPERRRQGE